MTRKDFEMIAKVVGNTLATVTEDARQCLALDFAYALKETNPRFDTSRFVKACLSVAPEDRAINSIHFTGER
jgi:hypothetical protein